MHGIKDGKAVSTLVFVGNLEGRLALSIRKLC
jgi:hypothetical protein